MESNLTYDPKSDWGNKPLSAKYARLYGCFVFLLSCGWVWKIHRHPGGSFVIGSFPPWELSMAVLAILLAISLVANCFAKPDKNRYFLIWYWLAFGLLNVILLLRV
jgi:hypothetical protein